MTEDKVFGRIPVFVVAKYEKFWDHGHKEGDGKICLSAPQALPLTATAPYS